MISKNKIACLLFFVILFLYMMTLGFLTPKMSDDFGFSLQIVGLGDLIHTIFLKTYIMYLHFSGRVITYFTEYTIFSLPVFVGNILSSIMFCLLVYGIFLNATLRPFRETKDLFTLFLILATVWNFVYEFAEVIFWKTGSTSYLWPLAGTLYFIYPFVQLIYNRNLVSPSVIKIVLVIMGAFILSTGHEALSAPVCALLLFSNALYYHRNKKIPKWALLAAIIYILGTILLIVAPGNFARNKLLLGNTPDGALISVHKFLDLSKSIVGHFTIPMGSLPLFVLLLVGLALVICENSRKRIIIYPVMVLILCSAILIIINNKIAHIINILLMFSLLAIFIFYWLKNDEKLKANFFIFFGLSLLAAYDMIAVSISVFGNRTAFFSDIFFIIAIISVLSRQFAFKKWDIIYGSIATVALFLTIPSMIHAYENAKLFRARNDTREALIAIYQKNGIKTPILSPLFQLEPTRGDLDLFVYQPHLIVRDIISTRWSYYGFKQVIENNYVVPWSEIERFVKNEQKNNQVGLFVKENILYYLAVNSSCNAITNKKPFFLRIYPSWLYGFFPNISNKYSYQEFMWNSHQVTVITNQGQIKKDICILASELPNYDIKKIETGQYSIEDGLRKTAWQKVIVVK